jgi:hypothetical protein
MFRGRGEGGVDMVFGLIYRHLFKGCGISTQVVVKWIWFSDRYGKCIETRSKVYGISTQPVVKCTGFSNLFETPAGGLPQNNPKG